MNLQPKGSSERGPRLLTLFVLLVVTAAIALMNFAAEPVDFDTVIQFGYSNKSVDREYGWPLTWYWRSQSVKVLQAAPTEYARPHLGFWHNVELPWKSSSPVVRYGAARLATDFVVWLAILGAVSGGCRWLLRRWHPSLYGRPRIATLVVLIVLIALMVLANLSSDRLPEEGISGGAHSYGWPWIWYRYFDLVSMTGLGRVWDYSTARLIGNVLVCVLILLVAGLASQWLLHRYPPRLRWSLRTMLVGVTITAALCGGCVALRNRAQLQDAIDEATGNDTDIYYQRSGPKWLDLFGADRFRRRIVAAHVHQFQYVDNRLEQLTLLAKLRSLRFLDIEAHVYKQPQGFSPEMAATLGEMRQLRALNVDCQGDDLAESRAATNKCLSAVGKLTKLKRLRLSLWNESSDYLSCLDGLTNLKTLSLVIYPFTTRDYSVETDREVESLTLTHLPGLPELEALDLDESEIGDQNLARLAGFAKLKLLDLSYTSVSDLGLAKLAPLEALEELAIDEAIATAPAFQALGALKRLKKVHIAGPVGGRMEYQKERISSRAYHVLPDEAQAERHESATLTLDDGQELLVLSNELDALQKAIAELRKSHPGIVIDAAYPEFHATFDIELRSLDSSRIDSDMQRLFDGL